MTKLIHRQNRVGRATRAESSLEIAISAFLMIALAAFALDITMIFLGMDLNDAACRDAARAAAQQSTQAGALKAAQSQLIVHTTDGYWISQPTLRSTGSPDFVYNDYSGSPPANTSPYVTVTTVTNIRCPAPIFFFGAVFLKGGVLQFNRRYTFPIIKETFYG